MATILACGPGQTYTTLADAVAAIPNPPTGGYEIHITGKLTAGATIEGFTTSATNYIKVTAAAGQSFKDNFTTSTALYYNDTYACIETASQSTEGVIRANAQDYLTIDRLQFKQNGGYYDSGRSIRFTEPSSNNVVRECIFWKNYSSTAAIVSLGAAKGINCVVYDSGSTPSGGAFGGFAGFSVINCSIIRVGTAGGTPTSSTYTTNLIKNTSLFNWNAATGGTWNAGSGYNGTDKASAPGSNNQTSLTFANQFENTSNDFRLKSGANLIGAGNTDATNAPNDIIGTVRGVGTAGDIGAWEFAAAAGGTSPKFGRLTSSVLLNSSLVR